MPRAPEEPPNRELELSIHGSRPWHQWGGMEMVMDMKEHGTRAMARAEDRSRSPKWAIRQENVAMMTSTSRGPIGRRS